MKRYVEKQRMRKLYSMHDFQMALSAADFLSEIDHEEKYTKVELRRFRCFETAMIVSYARPFSESKGGMPRLSLKQCKAELTKNEHELHERILNLRNKLFAHSDEEYIRFSSTVLTKTLPDDRGDMHIPLFQFDEGMQFSSWRKTYEVMGLIRKLMHGLMNQMFDEAQIDPEKYDWKKD